MWVYSQYPKILRSYLIFSVYVHSKSYVHQWSAQGNQNPLLSLKVFHLILTLVNGCLYLVGWLWNIMYFVFYYLWKGYSSIWGVLFLIKRAKRARQICITWKEDWLEMFTSSGWKCLQALWISFIWMMKSRKIPIFALVKLFSNGVCNI